MAARAPDPLNLRHLAEKVAPIIDTDKPCRSCGYNLRGLRAGVLCPECGTPSVIPKGIDDPLSVMPMSVILALVRGCWVAAICVALMVAALLAERLRLLPAPPAMSLLFGLSVIWVGAVIWLTPSFALAQAATRGFGLRSRLRPAARWLQLGWVAATGAAAINASLATQGTAASGLLWAMTVGGIFVGLAGVVVLSIMLEQLADWVRDEDAQRMFNWAAWSWPIAILFFLPIRYFLVAALAGGGLYAWWDVAIVVLWILAIGTFPYGLLLLAKSVTLAILHNLEHRGRLERRAERNQAIAQRYATRAAASEPQPMRRNAISPNAKPRLDADR